MQAPYSIADYLLDKLASCGIGHPFGVPGDYNLQFLDHVTRYPGTRWAGCANESSVAYAADGHARVSRVEALPTMLGVGELNAIDGIAGSCAEHVSVLHIVGALCRDAQRHRELMRHALGDDGFQRFYRMQQAVTTANAILDEQNACYKVDRVLRVMLIGRGPDYLMLPTDVAKQSAIPPNNILIVPLSEPESSVAEAFRFHAHERLLDSPHVALLADFPALYSSLQLVLQRWMAETPMAHATLLVDKGLFDERHPTFVGTYSTGTNSDYVRQAIEDADTIMCVGAQFVDTLTAGFTQQLPQDRIIDVQSHASRVGSHWFNILMEQVVIALRELCLEALFSLPPERPPTRRVQVEKGPLTQGNFWHTVQQFLEPGDTILVDQGAAASGATALSLPYGAEILVQPLWGSIGYALPAASGAQTAYPDRRMILIIGGDAAQLTIQELGSMFGDGRSPVILLLNNDGYTVKRVIHGANQRYNDIIARSQTLMPRAFSRECQAKCWRMKWTVRLEEMLARLSQPQRLLLIEVVLPKADLPESLRTMTRALESHNDG